MNNKRDFDRVSFILSMLIIVCAMVVAGAYTFTVTGVSAKYVTSSGQARDSARAARWNVRIEGRELTATIIESNNPDSKADYELKITSTSETALEYTIKINGLPYFTQATIGDQTIQSHGSDMTYEFKDSGGVPWTFGTEGTRERTHIITVKALEGAYGLKNQKIIVSIDARQVD